MTALLRTEGVTMRFGGLTAVSKLTLAIAKNEIVGLIGPNGAGKTTAFNVITGMHPPTEGRVLYRGEEITGLGRHRSRSAGSRARSRTSGSSRSCRCSRTCSSAAT